MRRNGKGNKDSCEIPFHFLLAGTLVGATAQILVSPNANISPRLLQEADAWAHFRFRTFAFRLHPLNAVTNLQVAGYVGGIQDTQPSTAATISELLPSCVLGGRTTRPSDWVRIPKIDLSGPLPWYKTIPGTADATEEAPGTIGLAGTGTDGYNIEFKGICQFKTAVATGNTPMARKAIEIARQERLDAAFANERALLLRILASKEIAPPKLVGA